MLSIKNISKNRSNYNLGRNKKQETRARNTIVNKTIAKEEVLFYNMLFVFCFLLFAIFTSCLFAAYPVFCCHSR